MCAACNIWWNRQRRPQTEHVKEKAFADKEPRQHGVGDKLFLDTLHICLNGSSASRKLPEWVAHLQIWNALLTLLTDLDNLHPLFRMCLLQCCRKDVLPTTTIRRLFYAQLLAYVFCKVVIEATLLIAGKPEGMPYTWIDYGPEHAIWEACLKPMH